MDYKKFATLPIFFSVNEELTNEDTRFIKVTIDVLHTGKNYNDSIFEKETVDACIDTIKNTAILGYIRELPNNEKDFKGHEYILTKTDSNGIRKKYIGSAYGLIPESCNPRWVTKVCDDGIEREFLQVDGLLWSKFEDASSIMLNDISKPNSMELDPTSIEGYENEDGNFVFTKFSFNGCCILGDDKEPAMTNSVIEVQFSMSDFAKSIQKELNDIYNAFSQLVNVESKGGNETMPKDNKDFTLSVMQQFENIANIVRQQETYTDRWGDNICRYSLVDIQDNEVIVVDRKDNYNYYGFSFSVNGDVPTVDFSNATRKKVVYENYGEDTVVPEGAFDFGTEIQGIEDKAFSKVEDATQKATEAEDKVATAEENYTNIKTEYDIIKADYDEIKPKYDNYVATEQARQEAEIDAQKDAEFAKVEDVLANNEDFISLKNKKSELSLDEVINQCAILFTKVSLENKANFTKKENQLVADVMDDNDGDTDGYVQTKYGNIPVKR